MIKAKVCYYHIVESDFTGVIVVLPEFILTNFDPLDHVEEDQDDEMTIEEPVNDKVYLNQVELFPFPSSEAARDFYLSCNDYSLVDAAELQRWQDIGFDPEESARDNIATYHTKPQEIAE